eukprot:12514222-Alexandrium_andersonii.AAC.1
MPTSSPRTGPRGLLMPLAGELEVLTNCQNFPDRPPGGLIAVAWRLSFARQFGRCPACLAR